MAETTTVLIGDGEVLDAGTLVVYTTSYPVVLRLKALEGLFDVDHRMAEGGLYIVTAKLSPLYETALLTAAIDVACRLSIDLEITSFQFNQETAAPEEAVNLTLIVTNNGPYRAEGSLATVTLPEGLAFVSATCPGEYDDATGIWTYTEGVGLQPDEGAILTISATVEAGQLDGAELTATAAITSDQTTTDWDDDYDTALLTVAVV